MSGPHRAFVPTTALAYKRILLKISGEALAGPSRLGFDFDVLTRLAGEIKAVGEMGVGVGLVIGGGNIVRGTEMSKRGMDRVAADYMGCWVPSLTPWRFRMCWSVRVSTRA